MYLHDIMQAPTFMELAGQSIPEDMDGVSLKQLLLSNDEREKQVESIIIYNLDSSRILLPGKPRVSILARVLW